MLVASESLGRPVKAPVEPADFIPLIRRSLAASRAIAAGQALTESDLVIKRPGSGIQPEHLTSVVGMRALTAIAEDETITWDKLSRQ
jgi:sialic acid synthase SpsE